MMVAMPMPPPMHSVISAVDLFAALELVEGGAEQDRAGRAERVAEGDRAAVDVDAVGIDAERARRLQRHHGERLVDLPQVDVARPSCRPCLSAFADAGAGAVSMITGSAPAVAIARMRARGLRPAFLPHSLEPISTAAAPSTMPDELPPVWTWSISFVSG